LPTLRVDRRIHADPTSTALLLAGPSAVELWPESQRVGEVQGRLVVRTGLPDGPGEVEVQAWPPRRTPVAFVVRFTFWPSPGSAAPHAEGTLVLRYDAAQTTHAELALQLTGSQDLQDFLTGRAEQFLANLAHAAEARAEVA
jgi:hypothetical protein